MCWAGGACPGRSFSPHGGPGGHESSCLQRNEMESSRRDRRAPHHGEMPPAGEAVQGASQQSWGRRAKPGEGQVFTLVFS